MSFKNVRSLDTFCILLVVIDEGYSGLDASGTLGERAWLVKRLVLTGVRACACVRVCVCVCVRVCSV